MRWARDNGLSLFFGAIFLVSLVFQSIAGHAVFNDDARMHGSETVSYARYLVSSHFGQGVLENWQSEYLQFSLMILATIWLVQKGSTESKPDVGRESDEEQKVGPHAEPDSPAWARARGWRRAVYSDSLLILMALIFVASWFGQSVTGWTEFNGQQRDHDQPAVSWSGYLTEASFWEDTLQNWQSEFLAVGSMAVFSIFLRARGSAESKPVGEPHDATGSGG
ncbi:MAG TPA: DUF6766 family protein [Gaiellaceae bacterium]|nr:DUF6766 family protein [Gaiellaceae bacterium]